MKIVLRRTIAILGGLAFPIVALFWSHIGAEYALKIFQHVHDVASVIGPNAMYKSFGDVYVLYAKYGLCLATGLSFAMMMWDRRLPAKRVTAVYWIFLAVALPLTLLNYEQGDILVSRMKQALVDVVIVFLSAVCALNLAAIKPASIPARVLQILTLFFIAFQGIFVPAIFAILWSLNWQRAISLADSRSFTPGWVSAAAAIGSLAMSILQFRRTKPTEMPQSSIIIK